MNPHSLAAKVFKPSELSFTSALPPLGLYIHLPWCVRKCPYCDFNSHLAPLSQFKQVPVQNVSASKTDQSSPHSSGQASSISGFVPVAEVGFSESLPIDLQKNYLQALIADLDQQLPKVWGRRLHSIFIGGGTPSLFSPEIIDELLGAVRARLGMPATGEVTLEANPGTFELQRFKAFRQAGVTRLSIGVQSFSDSHLQVLGRIHQGRQAVEAINAAVGIFDEVNVDLMYALPNQSIAQALSDLQQAIELGPTHLSLYQLTMEPQTQFAHKQPEGLPDDDLLSDIEDAVHQKASEAGYARYEISAFSKPGHPCQHNLNYWGFGDYLGIGAGAHAKISYPNRIERETRHRNPNAYMEHMAGDATPLEQKALSVKELPFEFMLNAMRLTQGVPEQWFAERCGRPLSDLQKPLNQAVDKGLIEATPGSLKPTELGLRFQNELIELFLGQGGT